MEKTNLISQDKNIQKSQTDFDIVLEFKFGRT